MNGTPDIGFDIKMIENIEHSSVLTQCLNYFHA